jgi:uncharacterized protein YndB with AHSA1/START domain
MNASPHRLIVRRTFAIDPEDAFRAWSDPNEMRRWFSPIGFTTPVAEAEVRPGGHYRVGMQPPEGPTVYARGTYREVAPPDRLVFTWSWEEGTDLHGGETLVTVEFRAVPTGTEVILTHELLPSEQAVQMHREGWEACLANLARHLEAI